MSSREKQGIEAGKRLRDWQKGHTAAERLVSILLRIDGFTGHDPSHPLGGPDGGVDIRCKKAETTFAVAVYFPRGEVSFSEIRKKAIDDASKSSDVRGFLFATNQELTIGQRAEIIEGAADRETEIYHLEKLSSLLNCPHGYGPRLDFLDIPMEIEEQVSWVNEHNRVMSVYSQQLANALLEISRLTEAIKQGTATTSLKPEKSPADSSSNYVTPKPINNPMGGLFGALSGSKVHRCGHCSFSFLVGQPNVFYAPVSLFGETHSVRCPKCGSVDVWNRPFG